MNLLIAIIVARAAYTRGFEHGLQAGYAAGKGERPTVRWSINDLDAVDWDALSTLFDELTGGDPDVYVYDDTIEKKLFREIDLQWERAGLEKVDDGLQTILDRAKGERR